MNARISPAEPPFAPHVQEQLDRLTPPGRPVLALFRLLANDPRLFDRFIRGGLLDSGNLTIRQREIVIDRVTAQCGSEYEWGVHVAIFGGRAGLAPEEIASLVHGGAGDGCWADEGEKVLIDACDELHRTCTISQPIWERLSGCYSEAACLEILMLAGFYRTVSYLTNATRLPLEDFAPRFPDAAAANQSANS